ncbi:MAG: TonB-dependent receptor [Ferruginibacter sp.]
MRKNRPLFVVLCTLFFNMAYAQTKTVTGTVTDTKSGVVLSGVTVTVKNSDLSTVTNSDGKFSFQVPTKASSLIFSNIGYGNAEAKIGNGPIAIKLSTSVSELTEVIVVGYGTKIKRDVTGSISKVGAKELNNTPVTSFESAIQGRAAGVFVSQQNGKLGQGINVRIRGSASVTAGNEPLYVIDGIPLQNSDLSSNGSSTNSFTDINTNDIESIEILKDASAAAIYGSRGSNGVVLITTKKGKAGKSKIEFGYFTGTQKPTGKREFLNSKEYVDYFIQAAAGAATQDSINGYYATVADALVDELDFVNSRLTRYSAGNTDWQTQKVNTNWQDQAFQDAPVSQYDINLSGGNEKTTFYLGGQYFDQTGIILRNSLKRYSARLNLDHKVKDWLSVGINLNFVRSLNKRISNDNAFSTPLQIVALSPITPLIDPRTGLTSGALNLATGSPNTNYPLYYNPILSAENTRYNTLVNRTIGNVYGNVNITKGLVFRTEFGIDQLNQNEDQYAGRLTARNQGVANGSGFNSSDQILNFNTNNFLKYTADINDKHSFDILAGTSFQKLQSLTNSASAEEFASDSYKKLSGGASKTAATSSASDWVLLSYFARANYKYKDRYLLSASGRYDGSSRFGANNRFGFFPAVSAGWIISDESFLQNTKWLNFLKLKASYGLTGNSEISNYASRGLFGPNPYGGLGGQVPVQLPNPDLKWESTASSDLGLEASIINRRITVEVDVYQRKTKDLLLSVNVPSTTGFLSKIQNIGKLENKGVEVTINTENVITKNFRWSTSLNFAANKNRITDLGGQQIGTLNRAMEGEPLGVFYAKEFAGADPANGDALYIKNTVLANGGKDRGTTNNVNEAEDVRIGNPNPDFLYGMRNTFTYKSFDLDVLLQGVYGNEIFNGGGQYMSASGSNGFDNQTRDQLNAWKKPGDITQVPEARLFYANGTDNSSRFISDGSYLRVKAVTFGYNLSPKLLAKLKIDKARVYFRAQNLFTITNYQGWDPEVNADYQATNINQGVDFYSAPQLKTIVFGINIGL